MISSKGKQANAMVKLIEAREDGIYESQGCVLARAWRVILFKYGISGTEWHAQMDKLQVAISNKKRANNIKGNFTRQLSEPKLSWNGLMNGLAVLEFTSIGVTFHLNRKGKSTDLRFDVNIERLEDLNNNIDGDVM